MAEGGYWMIRTIRSGRVIEKSQFYVGERRPRAKRKKGSSSAKKRDSNAMSAVRRYARLMNCNFAAGAGILLTLHYDAVHLPADKTAAERELENFWRRLGYRLKKAGCELKATGITSELDGETGERVRLHHHLIISREGVAVTRNEKGELCALVSGVEIKWIPNYWEKTGRQCRLFPFIHYWCIRDETQFWNRSELDPILSLVDAADRQIAIGQLNDAMMANDIVLVEEGALADGSEFTNVPGAQVTVKQGRMGGVARLGGLNNGIQSVSAVNWFLDQIQRTSRNYDSNNGRETARVTTASGLLQLRGDAETQQKLKKADRDAGFCRLYELLDWLALEYFDDDRLLFIGAKKKGEQPQSLTYNGDDFARRAGVRVDMLTAAVTDEGFDYYPRVDVTVTAGDGLSKNPATTVEVLDKLAASQITADNWELLAAELEYLDIPQKQEIIEGWRRKFAPTVPSEVTQALESDPELLAAVQEAVQANAAATEPAAMSDTEPDMAAGMMQGETAEIAVQPVDTQVVAAL